MVTSSTVFNENEACAGGRGRVHHPPDGRLNCLLFMVLFLAAQHLTLSEKLSSKICSHNTGDVWGRKKDFSTST